MPCLVLTDRFFRAMRTHGIMHLTEAAVATTATTYVPSSRSTFEWFYVWMGGLCMVLPPGGFFGTYLVPIASGTFEEPPIVHLHALFSFAWIGLFVLQSWLIARGRVVRHRAIGLGGIALATATFFTGVIIAIKAMNAGIVAGNGQTARVVAIFPFTIIATFAGLVAAAIANVKRPEYHKRLMLMATLSIMPPALARIIGMAATLTTLAPRQFGVAPPSVVAAIAIGTVAGVAADLLIVAAMVYEWRKRGRPHRVYWIASGIILAVHVLRIPMSTTEAWAGFTEMLSFLAH
jgi:hypothetical protein